jgi:hypothetical protein
MLALVGEVVRAVTSLASGQRVAVLTIPMQSGSTHDVAMLNLLADNLPAHIPVLTLPDGTSLDVFTACLRRVDALMTMRLHAALLAHRLQVPTMGLVYDPKVRRHFDEVSRSDKALSLDSKWNVMAEVLSDLLREGRIADSRFLGALAQLESDAVSELERTALFIMSTLPSGDVVHLVPPERPAEATDAVNVAPRATFAPGLSSATGLELPERSVGVFMDLPNVLQLSLPTEEPEPGQQIRMRSALRLTSREPVEVAITLNSRYERPQNLGRVETRVRVGDLVFVDDLARSREPVLLRYRSKGEIEIPLELSLTVNQKCYPAASWPKYSRIDLRITGTVPVSDSGPMPCLFASAGETRSHELAGAPLS